LGPRRAWREHQGKEKSPSARADHAFHLSAWGYGKARIAPRLNRSRGSHSSRESASSVSVSSWT
jgi:hypothetical protein